MVIGFQIIDSDFDNIPKVKDIADKFDLVPEFYNIWNSEECFVATFKFSGTSKNVGKLIRSKDLKDRLA